MEQNRRYLLLVLLLLGHVLFNGCDFPFNNDGDNSGINKYAKQLYFLDKGSARLVMLNKDLSEGYSWDLSVLSEDSLSASLQGITFDAEHVWISIAGNDDQIYELEADSTSLTVLNQFDAPPNKQGSVRDIAYDGLRLWVLNSGSVTYANPPALYELNADSGTILSQYQLPGPEPRGLTYVPVNASVYGKSIPEGLYYSDKDVNKIYRFRLDKYIIEEVFASPTPPQGSSYIFPVGLSYSGDSFWLVNSSGTADLLYELDQDGDIVNMFELPYDSPGPIVWSNRNVLELPAPQIYSVTPNVISPGNSKTLVISGKGFVNRTGLECSFGTSAISVDSIVFMTETELKVSVTVSSSAGEGTYDVTITNYDGQSGVLSDGLTISNYDPSSGYIWFTDANSDLLYKVKISEFNIEQEWDVLTVAPGGSPQGLHCDGTRYWMTAAGSDDKIIRIDISGEDLLTELSFAAPPNQQGTVRELCYDGTSLWVLNDQLIYEVNPENGTVLGSIATPGSGARGIAFVGDNLYCNDYVTDSVYVYLEAEARWRACFAVPVPPEGTESNRYPTGMTFDGVNLWLANSTYAYDYIFQVDLNGNVIRTYEVPNRGDAQPTGLMFTKE